MGVNAERPRLRLIRPDERPLQPQSSFPGLDYASPDFLQTIASSEQAAQTADLFVGPTNVEEAKRLRDRFDTLRGARPTIGNTIRLTALDMYGMAAAEMLIPEEISEMQFYLLINPLIDANALTVEDLARLTEEDFVSASRRNLSGNSATLAHFRGIKGKAIEQIEGDQSRLPSA